MSELRYDFVHAARSLGRSRGFTAAAVVTLAIGIGATTAIVSVVDTVLLQPLSLPDADRLVRIIENERPRNMPGMTYSELLEWSSRTTTLTGMAAVGLDPQTLMPTPAGRARVTGGRTTLNYFDVLGVPTALGRTYTAADEANRDVAVVSFYAWQRFFAQDPGVVGSTIELRSSGPAATQTARLLTVVGVLARDMEHLGAVFDVYSPIVVDASGPPPGIGAVTARLRPGVSLTAASAEAHVIGTTVRPPRPSSAPPLTKARFEARGLKDDLVATLQPALRVLLAAVAVVLLIVCANLANLLLARGTARQREIATRLAIGATRPRIVRQVLTECALLAAAGAALGAVLGAGGVVLVKQLATMEADGVFRIVFGMSVLPRVGEIGVDLRLFAIAFGLSTLTIVLCALYPALQLSRTNHLEALGSRGVVTSRRDTHLRSTLVVGQMALATVLLVGAALLARSFVTLSRVDKGYDPEHVLAFQLVLPEDYSTARRGESVEAVLARVRAMPGVDTAGFAYAGIMVGIEDTVGSFVPAGQAPEEFATTPDRPRLKSLSWGYLDAVGARLVAGRLLGLSDHAGAPPVAVVNQNVVQRYFEGVNPVGSFLDWHGGRGPAVRVQVVGVVEDIRQASLERVPYAEVFMDYRQVIALQQRWNAPPRLVNQLAFGFLSFALRTRGEPHEAIPLVREAVAKADENAGIDAILPLERLVSNSVARQRFYAVLLVVFSAVAALLATVGIYGVLAYAVAQRTQEIGIRVALGATRARVLTMVLRQGLVMSSVGIVAGLAAAAAASRAVQSLLFGVTPLDATAFATVALGFLAVGLAASYLPARRATRIDPGVALRTE